MSVTYNAATNRRTGEAADANGNIGSYVFDIENRILADAAYNPSVQYSYAPGNKRVWRGTSTVDEVTFWSITGQRLATYALVGTPGESQYVPSQYYHAPTFVATQTATWYYCGGKLAKNASGWVAADRLGSVGKFC